MSDILIFSQNIKEIIKRELGKNIEVSIGGLSIEGQAMNKIPGVVSAHIRISADDKKTVAFAEKVLINFIDQRNNIYSSQPLFEKNPITISKIISNKQTGIFYDSEEMFKIHLCVGQIILHINQISNKNIYKKAKNVGTVGTYRLDDGQVTLGVDIRGVDKLMRDKMVLEITGEFKGLRYKETAGNGDPVAMDKKLVDLAYKVVKENNIGSVIKDFSPAGHDSQNFARAGHPAVMIFIPSRNGGIAHTPEEYSTPDDLQKGAQTLAALLYNL
jgi:acetylornithine deacetylase/succinyl-diaminopimelate desuccinylase-like protein